MNEGVIRALAYTQHERTHLDVLEQPFSTHKQHPALTAFMHSP